MASYFDALSRITLNAANGAVQNYLTDPERLKRYYTAIRGRVTSPGPARPVFRSNTDMMLLTRGCVWMRTASLISRQSGCVAHALH